MEIFRFIFAILISYFPALLAAFFSFESKEWYFNLLKPEFAPPSWVFGVVWSVLYFVIGLSLYFFCVAQGDFEKKRKGFVLFSFHLLLNASFVPVFFGLKSLLGGLFISVFLSLVVARMIVEFYKTSKISAVLLLPYLAWSIFATVLSYYIYSLNICS